MQFNNNFHPIFIKEPHPIIYTKRTYDPYRMTHRELKQAIVQETFRLQELKMLYQKEEEILNYGRKERIQYDSLSIESNRKESFVKNHSFGSSPVKMLAMTATEYPSSLRKLDFSNKKIEEIHYGAAKQSYLRRYQNDKADSQLANTSFGKAPKSQPQTYQDREVQRFKTIENRLSNVEKTMSHKKPENQNHQKQNQPINQTNKSPPRRKIVYDSPQKFPQNPKQIKAENTNDSIIAHINAKQTPVPISIKIASSRKLKTKSKSTVFMRPKSHTTLKLKIPQKDPLALESQINKQIQNRLKLLSCVFKDAKWKNDKNDKDFLINRFQMESKGRKEIKNIINTDPHVLKKHKMVVD